MRNKRLWNVRNLMVSIGVIAILAGTGYAFTRQATPTVPAANQVAQQEAKPEAAPQRVRPEPPEGPPNYLRTEGNKIVDAQGKEVRLTGVNWFGMETGTFAPHGLWERNWEDMLDQIVALGYNSIRLPYSNQLFDPLSLPEGIDYALNPDLRGLNGLQIMDKIVDGAGRRGLKIFLDRHRPDIEKQTNLWYNERYDEERWINDWKMLAARYLGNDTVIGADLHNEPHKEATWGTGDPKTDWRMAAEKAGNAILSVNPNWLIIVEGIENYNGDWYWWGGNLQGVAQHPVRLNVPNRLVYSPHDYGPGVWVQGWFKDPSYPRNLPAIWQKQWAYISDQGIAPILLGEFGGRRSDAESLEGQWQRTLIAFLKEKGMHYSYWAFNANSGDTGGILDEEDESWQAIDQSKQAMLSTYQAPKIPSGQYKKVDLAAAPPYQTATSKRAKLDGELRVLYHADDVYRPGDQHLPGSPQVPAELLQPQIRLFNVGPQPLPLNGLELRYWFNDAAEAQKAAVEFATVGKRSVQAEVVKNQSGEQSHYLKITFGEDAGKVLGKGGVVDIQARVSKEDGTYMQADDFSFDHSRDAEHLKDFRPAEKIALYANGKLIWGTEPGND
jgi:endoglucanase